MLELFSGTQDRRLAPERDTLHSSSVLMTGHSVRKMMRTASVSPGLSPENSGLCVSATEKAYKV